MRIPAQATVEMISPMLWLVKVRSAPPLKYKKRYKIFAKSDDAAAQIGLERFENAAKRIGLVSCP